MTLPKVLIIGQTFNNKTGGGITQSNLFSGWDKDKLAVACTAHLIRNSDPDICDNYYQLGQKEHKWVFPFSFLHRKFPSGSIKFKQEQFTESSFVKHTNFRSKLVDNFFYPLLKSSGLIHSISRIELSPDFCKWLQDFKPDVIYAQGQDRERILFSLQLHSYLKKPLIYHFMDDWPSTVSEKGFFKNYWFKKIDHDLRMLLGKATLLMSISDSMAEEYKIRYSKNFITFHNTVNIDFWEKYQKVDYKLSTSPTILYAGRTGLGIQSSLEIVAKAVDVINEELNTSIKFVLQTPEIPKWISKYTCVEHKGLVSYNDLPKRFSEADILLIPYDFSPKSIKYIQYSMPTKVPEYMMSGTPILIFAPEMTALVKYAKKSEWAKIVSKNDIPNLCIAIKDLILNKYSREKIGQNAKKIAKEKHDSRIVSHNFKKLISSIVYKT